MVSESRLILDQIVDVVKIQVLDGGVQWTPGNFSQRCAWIAAMEPPLRSAGDHFSGRQ
jgi:hypothetical protein